MKYRWLCSGKSEQFAYPLEFFGYIVYIIHDNQEELWSSRCYFVDVFVHLRYIVKRKGNVSLYCKLFELMKFILPWNFFKAFNFDHAEMLK